jgi:L-asparaginase
VEHRRVRLLALGGTIAMGASSASGVSHSVDAAELAAGVRAALASSVAAVEIEATDLGRLPGAHVGLPDVVALAGEVGRAFDGGATGVVVTQGTDTIEETAFLLELLGCAEQGPVVVTGAMRNPTLAGADGPANLAGAVATAAAPEVRGAGVLVVLGDDIHAARFVAKRHSSSPAAFASYPGPIGWLSEGRPIVVTRPLGGLALPGALEALRAAAAPEVALVRMWLGDDGRLAARAAELGYAGLVVEGLGGGHVPPGVAELLGDLAVQMPVVIASRTGAGATLRSTYAFAGGEVDLARRGLVGSGWLPGIKARLLLLALLAGDATREGIEAAFARFS